MNLSSDWNSAHNFIFKKIIAFVWVSESKESICMDERERERLMNMMRIRFVQNFEVHIDLGIGNIFDSEIQLSRKHPITWHDGQLTAKLGY